MHFLGLDFIKAPDGSWALIETNDIPVGLYHADELSRQSATPLFGGQGCEELAAALGLAGGPQVVGFLMSEGFEVAAGAESAEKLCLASSPASLNRDRPMSFVVRVLEDLNSVGGILRRHGHTDTFHTACRISIIREVAWRASTARCFPRFF